MNLEYEDGVVTIIDKDIITGEEREFFLSYTDAKERNNGGIR